MNVCVWLKLFSSLLHQNLFHVRDYFNIFSRNLSLELLLLLFKATAVETLLYGQVIYKWHTNII